MMRRTSILAVFALLSTFAGAKEAIDYNRLGWMSAEAIAARPPAERPPIRPACHGAWVTPIPLTAQSRIDTTAPIHGEAQWLYYDPDGVSHLNGDVTVSQENRTIRADNAELSAGHDSGRFTGNILIAEPGMILSGKQADIRFNDRTARLESTEFVSTLLNAHGRANAIEKSDDNVVRFASVEYSTCEPDHRVWYFSAKRLKLDPNNGRGTVHNATLHLGPAPVLYVPYFDFPIDDRRMSGLLIPRFGTTNDGGFDFAQPLYLNLAPNYDATLTPRLLSRRGVMAEGEFRYLLDGLGHGELNGAMLPGDKLYANADRKRVSWKHLLDSGAWRWATNVNYVSDNAYFTDLGTDLSQSNTTHQERTGEMEYHHGDWRILGRVQSFQTIDPALLDINKPYARLPQVLLEGGHDLPGHFRVGLKSELTRFQRAINDGSGTEINGERLRLEPSVGYRIEQPWGYAAPSLTVRGLAYRLEGNTPNPDSLDVPVFSLDSGLVLEREGSVFRQTLEPRFFYLYSPYRDQSALPNFDTASSTFNFAQLFRNSRFAGGDRIDDANQLSLGLTSRWLDQHDGMERLRASVGEILYFEDRRVRLNAQDPVATGTASGMAGEIAAQFNTAWSAGSDVLWTQNGQIGQFGLQVHYLPDSGDRLFNAGYSYRKEVPALNQKSLRQASASAVHPLNDNWRLLGLIQYNLDAEQSQDSLLGVQYDACCWRLSLYRRQFLADPDNISLSERRRSAVFVELTLKGLAGLSSSVTELLANKVFGFDQLQDRSQTRFRETP